MVPAVKSQIQIYSCLPEISNFQNIFRIFSEFQFKQLVGLNAYVVLINVEDLNVPTKCQA